MKKILLFAIIFSWGLTVNAQLDIPAEFLTIVGSPDDADFDHHFDVVNTTDEEVNVYWEMILDDEFPVEWESFLCDKNLCYTPFVRNCPEGMINVINPSETSQWILHVRPNGVEGEGTICLRFHYPQMTGDSISVDNCFEIQAKTTSVVEVDLSELNLYPNPTNDIFKIKSDENIKKIGIYNVVGKLVQEMSHTAGEVHNVESLSKGMYLVRLMDSNSQVIKTMKLSKR